MTNVLRVTVADKRRKDGQRVNNIKYLEHLENLKDKLIKIELFHLNGKPVAEEQDLTYQQARYLLVTQRFNG